MVTWHQENPPPAGVTYEWVGAPHASESIKRVDGVEVARNLLSNPSFESGISQVGVPSGDSSGATTVTDTAWHGQGSKSIKVIPGTANSSAFYPVSGGGTASPFLTPGNTYTFSALIHLEAPQTGDIFQRARRLTFGIRNENNVPYYDFATSDQAPNEPGTYRLSVTAAIPAGYLAAFLMMANGSDTEPVWFDDAMLEEGAGSGLYFDGNTPDERAGDVWFRTSDRAAFYWDGAERGWVPHTWDRVLHPLNGLEYEWAGEPHASESIKYAGGVEVARNVIPNPSFENPADRSYGWSGYTASLRVYPTFNDQMWGGLGGHMMEVTPTPIQGWTDLRSDSFRVEPGRWLGTSARVAHRPDTDARLRLRILAYTDTGGRLDYLLDEGRHLFYEGGTLHAAIRIREDVESILYTIQMTGDTSPPQNFWVDQVVVTYADTEAAALEHSAEYFDGDTPSTPPGSGVAEAGVATVDRRGLVGETFARSREKINIQLAEPDERLKGGERIELAAFAASSSEVTWRWRQVTGPEVFLVREGNTCHFQAPDVDNLTDMRIAVSASSVDGANRSDWHYFDLEIRPAAGRFAAEGSDGFLPHTPQMVGYNRGKREIWNDVIAPVGMDPEGRKEPKLVDLGIPADDVTFSLDGEEPARASAGAVYVDIQDGAIYRNFGGGYNETDDTTGAPRLNAYMVSPATGEVFEWEEGSDDGR